MHLQCRFNRRASLRPHGGLACFWGNTLGGWIVCWFLGVMPLLALNPDRKADSYLLQGWFTEHGLPSNKIRDVIQSRDGYLWLATGQGIVRFDGSHFTVFNDRSHPVIEGNDFFAVVETPDGALWFGGEGGLFRWRDGRFDRFTTAQGLAHNYVRGLGLMRDGTVVAGTRRGYSFVRDGKITTPGGGWKEITGVGRTFLHRSDGTMLLGTTTGLWRASGDVVEKLSGSGKLEGNSFFSLLETGDRTVWIGYSGGVQCLRPDGSTEQFGKAHGMTSSRVSALRQDHDGNLWIAASSSLYRIRRGRMEAADYADSFKGSPLQQVYEDREGGLWIATVSGLFGLKDTVAGSIGSPEGLATTFVQSLFQTSDRATWIGLWYGGVYRYDGTEARRVPGLAGLNVDRIFGFAEDRAGAVWIGADTGLYRYANGKVENFFSAATEKKLQETLAAKPDALVPALAQPWVASVAADTAGAIWVATEAGLYQHVDGKFRVHTRADGLAGNDFESVIGARNGDVWAAMPPQGVARRHEGQWINYLCGREISSHRPIAVYEDDEGDIWESTRGGGLNRFHQGKWSAFTSRQGLIDDYICSILDDGLGNLWIAYPRGIMRVPRAEFDEIEAGTRVALQPRIFNQSDGLVRGEINPAGKPNAQRLRDGRLLFATDLGVAVIDPRSVRINPLKPPTYIERFIVNGAELDLSRPIDVPPGRSDIQIHYTAISLLAPEKVKFRTRLAPIDSEWTEHENVRDLRYPRLPPGRYTFSVKACNNDGIWNEETCTVAFRVRPYFYQTGWFIGLGILSVTAASIGTIRIRARLARQRMAALEKTVELRTGELANSFSLLNATLESTADGILVVDRERRLAKYNRKFVEMWRIPEEVLAQKDDERLRRIVTAQLCDPDAFLRAAQELSGQPEAESFDVLHLKDGRVIERFSQPQYIGGWIGGRVWSFRDVSARHRAETELRWKTAWLEAQIDSCPDGILVVDTAGRRILQNRRFAELWRIPREIAEHPDTDRQVQFVRHQPKNRDEFVAKVLHLYAHPQETSRDEIELNDGTFLDRYSAPVHGKDGTYYGRIWTVRDITEQKRTQRQVIEASRQAGMAEIATGVVHNIGNVLNSVNVSATLVSDLLRSSRATNVGRVSALLSEEAHDLPGFFSRDPRGARLPEYLVTLNEHIEEEREDALRELEGLRKNIEHIREIVAMQQNHAKAARLTETVSVVELIEDAVRITDASLVNHGVQITRDFQSQPVITVEKHKVVQVLVNLIRNAKHACVESGRTDKQVTVRLGIQQDQVEIAVIDNGTGIARENMTRIFAHGFTTRKDGHGFGLHSGALAARELGGTLLAQSEGPGLGATFTLRLPRKLIPPAAA